MSIEKHDPMAAPTSDPLAAVTAAARAAEAADRALGDRAREALDQGETVTAVANAAGVTQQTIYRWRDTIDNRRRSANRPTREVLDGALAALLTLDIGPATIADVSGALTTPDLRIKAQRFRRGLRNLRRPMTDVPPEVRIAIEAGQVAARAVNAHDTPPEWVTVAVV